jgi:Zn-finger nucleic acid-binding protein
MPEDSNDILCPRCNLVLKRVGTSQGVFWACHGCGGRAIGVELLRRTFTPESINPLWLHAIRSEGRKSSPCPSCRNPMIEVAIASDTLVKVDVCRLCHFVWFDMCEADTLTPRSIPEKPAPLPQKAGEALAPQKVEQLAREGRPLGREIAASDFSWKHILEVLNTNVRTPN